MTYKVVLALSAILCSLGVQAQACLEMKNRPERSRHPKVYIMFFPNDYKFSVGTRVGIKCVGIKSNPVATSSKKEYEYPNQIQIYDGDKRIQYCRPISKLNERTAERTCAIDVLNYDEAKMRSIECLVKNGWGKCTKKITNIYITENESPTLVEQPPRHINTSEGLDLNITCKSPELPRPVITWYKNGERVTRYNFTLDKGMSTLMLRSIVPYDEGKYWCRVSNPLGEVKSEGTYITVFTSPKILKEPDNQTVTVGGALTLTCHVSGQPLPLIGWMRDGEDLGAGSLVTGNDFMKNRNLLLNTLIPSTSLSKSQSLSQTLSLSQLLSQSQSQSLNIPQSQSFSYQNTSDFSSLSTPSTTSPDTTTTAPDTKKTAHDSTILTPNSTTTRPDFKTITTDTTKTASNTIKTAPDSTTTVPDTMKTAPDSTTTVPDTMKTAPDSTTTVPGAPTTTLSASAITHYFLTTANVLTMMPTTSIPQNITTIPNISVATTAIPTTISKRPFSGIIKREGHKSTLIITSAKSTDQARYQCYANNALGNAKSTEALVSVRIQDIWPRFDIDPRNTSARLGMDVTLNCSATGKPFPKITWYKKDTLIAADERVSMTMVDYKTSLLNISSMSRDDMGMFTCRATNRIGFVNSTGAFLDLIDTAPDQARMPSLSSKSQAVLWSTVGTLMFSCVVMVIIVIFIVWRRKTGHAQPHPATLAMSSTDGDKPTHLDDSNNAEAQNIEQLGDLEYLRFMGLDRDWELARNRLQRTNDKLGSGCFGNVYSGVYTRKDDKQMLVAVKMLKVNATDEDRKDLIAELEILKQVGRHPNIVSLVGACTKDEPICIIIELVEGGNLQQILRKTRVPYVQQKGYKNIRSNLTDRDLITIALNVAKGMSHLHKKQCIHRDLAARNVLIGKGLVAKIADFGLARKVMSDGLYVKTTAGKVPWKWMAPEALRGLFTKQGDIWSFGILLWEIVTLGDSPYPNTSQVIPLYNLLVDGYRLEKPPQCDDLLYELMNACWSVESNARPGFDEIQCILQDILRQNERIYINLVAMELDDEQEHSL